MSNQINDPGIGTKFDPNVNRIINPDGTYNVLRKGAKSGFKDFFKYLVEISWWKFFGLLFGTYIVLNLLFTLFYLICGFENIAGIEAGRGPAFIQAFFFSIQTFTTVGYGALAPIGIATQSVAAIEAFVGFLSFSLATGLLYGRFSRPNSKLIFAKSMVYSKYEEGYSFKFKLANERDSVLQEVEAKAISMFNKKDENGEVKRIYYQIPLTISKIDLLLLTWTLVHKIDDQSPFWNLKQEEIEALNPEILIMINGFDEIYGQHTRATKSYISSDILWKRNFATIFSAGKEGKIELDIKDLNRTIDE